MLIYQSIANFKQETAVPKFMLQSNLFAVSRKNETSPITEAIRPYQSKTFFAQHSGLTQYHLALTLALKRIISKQRNMESVTFDLATLVATMQRKEGGKTRSQILNALKTANFELTYPVNEQPIFEGNVYKTLEENRKNHFTVELNSNYLLNMYQENAVCHIDTDTFLSLQPGIQTWLFGFMSSLPELTEITAKELHALSGSHYSHINDFKKSLRVALSVLQKRKIISSKHGVERDGSVHWQLLPEFKKPVDVFDFFSRSMRANINATRSYAS